MGSINDRVKELVAQFGAPDACLAELLCDRHDPDATAFIVVHESRVRSKRRPISTST
jgi:hypothetical protein